MAPLVVSGEALPSLADLQPGDCLVAFSRKTVSPFEWNFGVDKIEYKPSLFELQPGNCVVAFLRKMVSP
jgi:hypothetical protein